MSEKRRGGLNETDRLKAVGIDAKKASVSRVALGDFHVAKTGPTKHPRASLPVDPELVEYIKIHGVPTDERKFKAREDGDRLEVIDGCRRTMAGVIAEAWLQKNKPRVPPLEWRRDDPKDVGRLYVDVEIVICTDLEVVLHRLNANVARGLADSPSVLAATVAQIVRLNKGEPDADLMAVVLAAMPRTVKTGAVVLALLRWDNLADEIQSRYEAGDAPLDTLPAIVAARAEDRPALLDRLLTKGVRTTNGATRHANKAKDERDPWARRMSPRQVKIVADAVMNVSDTGGKSAMVAAAFRIAANQDVEKSLELLPRPIAAAIREARAPRKAGAR